MQREVNMQYDCNGGNRTCATNPLASRPDAAVKPRWLVRAPAMRGPMMAPKFVAASR